MSVNQIDISATLTPVEERYIRMQTAVIDACLGSEGAHAALDSGEIVNYRLREGPRFAQSTLIALYQGPTVYARRLSDSDGDVIQFSKRPISEC